MDNLKKKLEERKKSELIALIVQMLHEEPGLQRLLTSPLSTISSQKSTPDREKYRQQVQDALSAGDYRRHYKRGEVQQRLSVIKDTADQYATLENYAEVLTIYEVLVNEIIQHFNDYREEYIAFTVTLVACFYVRPESESWVFRFNPGQRLRALFGWSSTYTGER